MFYLVFYMLFIVFVWFLICFINTNRTLARFLTPHWGLPGLLFGGIQKSIEILELLGFFFNLIIQHASKPLYLNFRAKKNFFSGPKFFEIQKFSKKSKNFPGRKFRHLDAS